MNVFLLGVIKCITFKKNVLCRNLFTLLYWVMSQHWSQQRGTYLQHAQIFDHTELICMNVSNVFDILLSGGGDSQSGVSENQ